METQRTFLSYSRDDSAFALKLATDLRAAGANIWVDQLDIPTGKRWDLTIEEALTNAPQLIVLLSASSVGSNNVMDEVSYALEKGKAIIPVKLNECNIPFRLKRLQFIDFTTGYDRGFARLLADMGREQPPVAKALTDLDGPFTETRKNTGKINSRVIQVGAIAIAALVVLSILSYEFLPSTVSQVRNNADNILKDIRVWKVGSPHKGDVPDTTAPFDLQKESRTIGMKLNIEGFPAKDFAAKFFDAVEKHEEPDILTIDNYGIINGIDTPLGHFAGIGTSNQIKDSLVSVGGSLDELRGSEGGWQFLVSTSRNYQGAKSLALRQPRCESASQTTLEQVKKTDAEELHKYALKYVLDSDQFHVGLGGDFSIVICGFWGNRNLAFLDSIVTSESEKRLGWTDLLIIMEKKAGPWELTSLGGNSDIIMKLNNEAKLAEGSSGALPNELKITGPADGIKSTRDSKPSLQWEWQGDATSIVIYLLESQFSSNSRWFGSHFTSIQPQKNINMIAPFGVGAQPHRWRVWAIDRNGSTVRSDWSTIVYTN